jgi:hypothetical protein
MSKNQKKNKKKKIKKNLIEVLTESSDVIVTEPSYECVLCNDLIKPLRHPKELESKLVLLFLILKETLSGRLTG